MELPTTADNSLTAPSERETRAWQREITKLEAINGKLTTDLSDLKLENEKLLIDNTNLRKELSVKTDLLSQTQTLLTKLQTSDCEACAFNNSDLLAAHEANSELKIKLDDTERAYRALLEQNAITNKEHQTIQTSTAFHKIQVGDLPKFDGNSDALVNWIHHVETLKDIHVLKGTDVVKALPEMLTSKARDWLMTHMKNLLILHGHEWNSWKVVLQQQFRDIAKEQKLRTTYRSLSIKTFPSFLEYINQKYSLRNKLYGNDIPESESDSILIEDCLQFLTPNAKGLFKSIWRDYCNNDPPSWNDFVRGITAFLSTPQDRAQYDPCVLQRVPNPRTGQSGSNKTNSPSPTTPTFSQTNTLESV